MTNAVLFNNQNSFDYLKLQALMNLIFEGGRLTKPATIIP